MISNISVLSIPLFDGDIAQATGIVLTACRYDKKQNLLISATGAHGIVTANQNPCFKRVLNSFYMNLPDGMPSVWVSKLKGARQIKRCYGPDFFGELIAKSENAGVRHYFCGGKAGVAEELERVCKQKFHNNNIVGVYSPPFTELTDEEMMDLAIDINSRNVDIVWIGLSTPKQENFALRLSKHTNVHFLCTVGAAFDFYTGHLRQAPRWLQRLGLEWFFRLIMEPKRLWKRYWTVVPLFILLSFADLWKYLFDKSEPILYKEAK